MTGLGLTKYGFGVTYSVDSDTTVNRTYNGINFSADSAATKAQQLSLILKGEYTTSQGEPIISGGSLNAIVRALGGSIDAIELIQRNAVTDVA